MGSPPRQPRKCLSLRSGGETTRLTLIATVACLPLHRSVRFVELGIGKAITPWSTQFGPAREEASPRSAEMLRMLLSSKVVKAQLAERRG